MRFWLIPSTIAIASSIAVNQHALSEWARPPSGQQHHTRASGRGLCLELLLDRCRCCCPCCCGVCCCCGFGIGAGGLKAACLCVFAVSAVCVAVCVVVCAAV